jgi:hypothetical protein
MSELRYGRKQTKVYAKRQMSKRKQEQEGPKVKGAANRGKTEGRWVRTQHHRISAPSIPKQYGQEEKQTESRSAKEKKAGEGRCFKLQPGPPNQQPKSPEPSIKAEIPSKLLH